MNEEDRKYLKLINRDEQRIIEHKFTSDLIEQKEKKTKEELGIDSDKFVIAIVGGRLDYEISEAFLDMLENLVSMDEDIMYVLMGKYETKLEEKRKTLSKHIKCLGWVEDILGYYEACDLYVNPIRVGGGTSSVEAMSKGIPVVTVDYGDVATNVGEDFVTGDYHIMSQLILKYKNDAEFYQMQSDKAKERATELLDTSNVFAEVVTEFVKRVEAE